MSRKSDIVSAAGLLTGIFTRMVEEVKKKGGDEEDIHRLTTPEADDIWPQIAEVIVSGVRQTFKVLVDYSKSLAEMVSAGKYDWVNLDITNSHFPIQGSGQQEKEVVLFHFNKVVSSEEAIVEMEKQGFCPAKIEDLLALGANQPELQKQFSIAALGSSWRRSGGALSVPLLGWCVVGRSLGLGWFVRDWDGRWRFAAVRK